MPVNYHAWSTKTEAYAEVRIQDDSEPANDAIFDAFHTLKEQIEDAYGEALVWDRLDGKHGSKINTPRIDIGSRADPTETGLRDLAIASDRLIAAIRRPSRNELSKKGASGQIEKLIASRRSIQPTRNTEPT